MWPPSQPVTIAGGFAFVLSLACATWVGCAALDDPFTATLREVRISPAGLAARVDVELTIMPHARARFRSLDGELRVNHRSVPYRIDGLEPGDLLLAREPISLTVTATAGGLDVARGVFDLLGTGSVPIGFEGKAAVSVMGIGVQVPIDVERRVRLFRE